MRLMLQDDTRPDMDQKAIEAANRKCLRCHSLATLGYKSAAGGLYVDLSVDPAEFHASNHGKLACVKCHPKAFETFPHAEALRRKQRVCLDCHKEGPQTAEVPVSRN